MSSSHHQYECMCKCRHVSNFVCVVVCMCSCVYICVCLDKNVTCATEMLCVYV